MDGETNYKQLIMEMIAEINNELYLKMIYAFTKSAYEEEKGDGS